MVEPPFTARILRSPDARVSYVLARLGQPGLTLEAWRRRLARGAAAKRGAVVGILNQGGCLVALFAPVNGAVVPLASSPIMTGAEDDLLRLATTVLHRSD